jgi:hypothetical protein
VAAAVDAEEEEEEEEEVEDENTDSDAASPAFGAKCAQIAAGNAAFKHDAAAERRSRAVVAAKQLAHAFADPLSETHTHNSS